MSSYRPTPAAFLADHGLRRTTGAPIPGGPSTVAELVSSASARGGAGVALVDRRRAYSFVELEDAVDRAATVLAAAGLRPLDRVAVSLPNTTDVVIAYLAAMRAGLVWVGVNTHLAVPEQLFLLADSGVDVLVADAGAAAPIVTGRPGLRLVPVDVADPGAWFAGAEPAPFDPAAIDPFGPAAIAYTSGTTGRPKGAVHSQHNMLLPPVALLLAEPEPLVQGVILPLTILNMQVLATAHSLLSCSTNVPLDRIDVVGVAEAVRRFGVQRMYATPPTVYDLLTRPEVNPADIATLTHLGVGGAKAPAGMRERYAERFGRDFTFGYGLTEAPTGVTGTAEVDRPAPIGSSGRSRAHVEVTIRDAQGALVGPDVEGEICVEPASSGPLAGCYTTMLGYWDRPDATDDALRGGVLHTGDIGVIDADGCLWVRDRRSELIIRGGANVYPAEVERVVEATGLVAEVSVVGRDDARLGEEVVAFVAPAPGTALDVEALDRSCREQLAAYKVPVTWYEVTSFPRNAMGKVVKPHLRQWLADGEPTDGVLRVRRHERGRRTQ